MQRAPVGTSAQIISRFMLVLVGIFTIAAARAADPEPGPIALRLHSESRELTLDAVERALAEELKIPTIPADSPQSGGARGVLTVTYRPLTKELVVSYAEAARGTVTRVAKAPERVSE